jgi:hypothetical protein
LLPITTSLLILAGVEGVTSTGFGLDKSTSKTSEFCFGAGGRAISPTPHSQPERILGIYGAPSSRGGIGEDAKSLVWFVFPGKSELPRFVEVACGASVEFRSRLAVDPVTSIGLRSSTSIPVPLLGPKFGEIRFPVEYGKESEGR